MKKIFVYILLWFHVFFSGNIWVVLNNYIVYAEVWDIGHWRDSVGGQIPGTGFTGFNFDGQIRNDGIYAKPSNDTIQLNEAGDYLIITTTTDEDTSNGRYNSQLRVSQTAWTGELFTSHYSGYSRDNSENESWTRAISIIIWASANSQIQVQKRRDTDAPTWWSIINASDVQVIRLTQTNYWIYTIWWTGNVYGWTAPNTVSIDGIVSQSDAWAIEWNIATDTVTVKWDNKKYLVAWSTSFSWTWNRTQRIWHLDYDGNDILSTRSYCYRRNTTNEYCGLGSMDLIETWAADIEISAEVFRGPWTWADQWWADTDQTMTTDGNGQMIILEMPDTLEAFRSEDSIWLQDVTTAQTINFARDVNINSGWSFTKNSDSQISVTNPADIFSWSNIWTARSNIAAWQRQTSFGSIVIDWIEQSVWKHWNYSRWNQWTIDTFAMGFQPAGIYTTTWAGTTLWVNTDPLAGWEAGWNDRTQPGTVWFFALNFDTLVEPQIWQVAYRWFENINSTDVGNALALQNNPAILSIWGEAFRLRSLIAVRGNQLRQNEKNFKLQFAEKVWTCDTSFSWETYIDVTTSTNIAFHNNPTPSDEDNLTPNINDPIDWLNPIVNQSYQESNNFTTSVTAIPENNLWKWDFSLIDNWAPGNTSYCLRMVESDNTLLDDYSVIPEITTGGPAPFITTWKTDNAGTSTNTQITIPTVWAGYNYDIDCNSDGILEATGVTWNYTCNYLVAWTYTVEISWDFPRIYFVNGWDKEKILSVEQWWDIQWSDMTNSFYGATNLDIAATDAPDFSNTTRLINMFLNVKWAFSGDLTWWDVNNITLMTNLFAFAPWFNQDLTGWDTSNVTSMQGMFYWADSFNTPLPTTPGWWNTSKVTTMTNMFLSADAFNQDISSWDTSKVTTMVNMFNAAFAFNHDISSWNVSSVTNMQNMFLNANSFNQPLIWWDVSSVTNMQHLFYSADVFNQDLSSWDTSSATNMNGVFRSAFAFDQDLSSWDISNVTDMTNMLSSSNLSIANYDATLSSWNSQSVTSWVPLWAASLTYCASTADRANLITTHNWIITWDMDCNSTPTDIVLSNDTIDEWVPANTVVGTLSSIDANPWDTHTYSFVSGAWDADNWNFTISGNTLSINSSPDFDTQWLYSIRVETDDGNGGTFQKILNVVIKNLGSEPPTVTGNNITTSLSTDLDWDGQWDTWDIIKVEWDSTADGNNLPDSEYWAQFDWVNDRVLYWDNANLKPTGDFSVWIRATADSLTTWNGAVSSIPSWGTWYGIQLWNAQWIAAMVSWVYLNANITPVVGKEYYIVLTHEEASETNKIYVNWILQNQNTRNITYVANTPVSLWSFYTTGSLPFDWELRDFQVYDDVLSDSEVENIYTTRGVVSNNLVARNLLNETDGTLVQDDSGNGNTWTAVNISESLFWHDNITTVESDLSQFWGGTSVMMYDDGVTGWDSTANDNIWTSEFTILPSHPQWAQFASVSATDSENQTTTASDDNSVILNDDPTDITLSNNILDENVPASTIVWTLTTTDPNTSDTHTYSFVSGAWDTDNSVFTLSGSTLSINNSPDFEIQSSYSIRIETDDGNGWTFEKIFTITINDLDEQPPTISSSSFLSGSLLPGGNHNIVINYSDADSWVDTSTANIELYKWDGISSFGSDISASSITTDSVSTTSASYDTNNLDFGKYRYIFTIDDNSGNTTTETIDLYIDAPEFTVSTWMIDIWDLNHITNTFSDTVTVTVKTVWAWFDVYMNSTSPLEYWIEKIELWDGTNWFGYDPSPYSSNISNINTNQNIWSQSTNINTNGDKNIYTFDIKIWALIEAYQVSWEYEWKMDFWIIFDY